MTVNMKTLLKKLRFDSWALSFLAFIIVFPLILLAAKNTLNVTPAQQTHFQETTSSETNNPPSGGTLEKVENRQPLSATDAKVKAKLLALLPDGQKAGIIHQSPNIRVEYILSLDQFNVEIVNTNIANAKKEGNAWFLEQGLSQKGLCDLPLRFYLNNAVFEQMPDIQDTFNPLPDGC